VTTTFPGAEHQKVTECCYALYTRSRQEKLIKEILESESRNTKVFLSSVRTVPRSRRKSQDEGPFFPRCLFGHLALAQPSLSSINVAPGAPTVVSFDGQPAAVPDDRPPVCGWPRSAKCHRLGDSLGRGPSCAAKRSPRECFAGIVSAKALDV
jgi:hypothetical protein